MSDPSPLAGDRRRFRFAVGAAALVGAVLAVSLQHDSLAVRESANGLGLLGAGLFGALCCGWRSTKSEGRRRRAWGLFMVAALVALVGNAWSTLSGADPVTNPSVVGEVSIAAALLLSIVGLLTFPSARRRGVDLIVLALDGFVAGCAVLVVVSVLVYPKLLNSVAADTSSWLSSLLFPVLDVVLATVAVLLLLRTAGRDRPTLALLSAGFMLYAVADLACAVLVAQGTFAFGTPLDLLWIAGYLLIALAALYPGAETPVADPGLSDTGGTILVFGFLLVAAFVQVAFVGTLALTGPQASVRLMLILAVGVRQILLTYDNAALRRGLERRVRDQTADIGRLARQTDVLLSSVGDGIYGVDHQGRITFINPSAAAALGYQPEELSGRRAHQEFHGVMPDGTPYPWEACYVSDAMHSGLVSSAEDDVYVRADGSTFPVEITASPLMEGDRIRGAVVVFRDVTHRHEVDRMKNEFLSVVSHELRTPLTSIRGSMGLLGSGVLGELSPKAKSLVTIALESSERLTRLINDLLDIERIESGTRPMDVAVFEAGDLLRTAAQEIDGLARTIGVRVEVGPSAGQVLAHRDSVVQTLTNLLGNAIKYSDEGGTVHLSATALPGQVAFSVSDDGRGIPHNKLESVFERFEQVDSSDARQKGGTGLGLAICRGLVEEHGGRIWVESTLGEGTTVHFTLPASAPEGALTADAKEPALLSRAVGS